MKWVLRCLLLLLLSTSTAAAIDDQTAEFLVERASGIAEVEVRFDAGKGPNTYHFLRWLRPLPAGELLIEKWDAGCVATRAMLEWNVREKKKQGEAPPPLWLAALNRGSFQLVLFFFRLEDGGHVVWCEANSVWGCGWTDSELYSAWRRRVDRALAGLPPEEEKHQSPLDRVMGGVRSVVDFLVGGRDTR